MAPEFIAPGMAHPDLVEGLDMLQPVVPHLAPLLADDQRIGRVRA